MFKVLTKCATGSPEDCWHADNGPVRFDTLAAAYYAIIELVSDINDAFEAGDMPERGSFNDYIIERV